MKPDDVPRSTVIRIVIEASHFTSPRGRTGQHHPLALDPEHPNVVV